MSPPWQRGYGKGCQDCSADREYQRTHHAMQSAVTPLNDGVAKLAKALTKSKRKEKKGKGYKQCKKGSRCKGCDRCESSSSSDSSSDSSSEEEGQYTRKRGKKGDKKRRKQDKKEKKAAAAMQAQLVTQLSAAANSMAAAAKDISSASVPLGDATKAMKEQLAQKPVIARQTAPPVRAAAPQAGGAPAGGTMQDVVNLMDEIAGLRIGEQRRVLREKIVELGHPTLDEAAINAMVDIPSLMGRLMEAAAA